MAMIGHYAATKFAVRGFTEAAAKEWAQYGIRVNGEPPARRRERGLTRSP